MVNKQIVVGTNSLTEAQYPAYTNHCQMWFRFGRQYQEYDFIFCNPAQVNIDTMRNLTCKVALERKAEYVLFVDDDVLVPFDGLRKLIDFDCDICAANVLIRTPPFDYMFFKKDGENIRPFVEDELDGKSFLSEFDGLTAVGCSFTLIKVSLLKQLKQPYFLTCGNCTEDIYFCVRALQQVPKATARVDLTAKCGHIMWPEIINPDNRRAYTEYLRYANHYSESIVAPIIGADNEQTQSEILAKTEIG